MLSSNIALNSGCKLQLYVDGQYRDLSTGSGSSLVTVQTIGNTITVRYTQSQFQVLIDTSVFLERCNLNVIVTVPVTQPAGSQTVGLLGSIDANARNDWMLPNGTVISDKQNGQPQTEYDYCTIHWCIRDPAQSLFTYEDGYGHADITRCNLPYTPGGSLDNVPEDILLQCNRNVGCIMDAMNSNLHTALGALAVRNAAERASRSGYGGNCSDSKDCFQPMQCIDLGGLKGKQCLDAPPACMWDWGDCSTVPCCEGQCVQLSTGEKQCQIVEECKIEWGDCSEIECCDGLTCVDASSTTKQCRDLSRCIEQWEDCTFGTCCDGLQCISQDNRRQCKKPCKVEQATCAATTECCDSLTCVGGKCIDLNKCSQEWGTCTSDSVCCPGLSCHAGKCRDVAKCEVEWNDCSVMPCCTGLSCVENSWGGKQCRDMSKCIAEWSPCNPTTGSNLCCSGLKCVTQWGSSTCKSCEKQWGDCSVNTCCDGLTCVTHTWGKQCLKV